jgi:zinc transporter ZupT
MEFLLMSLALIASVLIGGVIVHYFKATNKNKSIKLALAFSGGFLLAIIFQHLIPDLYHDEHSNIGMFIMLGFLIQLVLEYFSGGIEHGHVHIHKGQPLPWVLFISLSLHSIIEGIPLGNGIVGLESHGHGHTHDSLFLGIIFHQIPVAIALMTLLMNTTLKIWQSWMVMLLFAIMTPLGQLLGLFVSTETLGIDTHVVLAIVVGMFLHISTTIIFETSENHKFNLLKLGSILVGVGLAMGLY